jgi:hypothetical protein
MTRATRCIVLTMAALGTVAVATAAWAYWQSSGSGSGVATTGTLAPVTVSAFTGGDANTAKLYPGGPATDVMLRIDNTNAYPVTLVGVALTANGSITGVGGSGTCTTTGVTFSAPSNLSIAVAPGSHLVRLAGAAAMSAASDNGCQGASFHIPVTITVQK